ncbi:MAG: EAL domain-containing protein [Burkholderiaceae bacterium]
MSSRLAWQIGLAMVVVIAGTTAFAYRSTFAQVLDATQRGLLQTIEARAAQDSAAFLAARDNAQALRDEWVRRLRALGNGDPRAEFDAWFARSPDGLTRVRPERDDHHRLPSVYIRAAVAQDAVLRRQVLAAFDLLREWGPPMTQHYFSAYIDLPGAALVMYSPGVNWGALADAGTNNFDYPPVRDSAPDRNPARENRWTEPYFDDKAGVWMVSTVTPVDLDGQWVGTASQDVALDALYSRATAQEADEVYSLVLHPNGQLVVHPRLMKRIEAAKTSLPVDTLDDPLLAEIRRVVGTAVGQPRLVSSADGRFYLGLAPIAGPGWASVTVYPRALVERAAIAAAGRVVVAGACALVLALGLLVWVLRRELGRPLRELRRGVDALRAGRPTAPLRKHHDDEIGDLADAFNDMAQAIGERDRHLTVQNEQLQRDVVEREQRERLIREISNTMRLSADAAELGLWSWDVGGGLVQFDEQMARLHGLAAPGGRRLDMDAWRRLLGALGSPALDELLQAVRRRDTSNLRLQAEADIGGQRRHLSLLARLELDDGGQPVCMAGVAMDVTQRAQEEQRALHMATHDPLTGLPNRAQLHEALEAAIQAAGGRGAVMFIDLDRFKHVNDSLGHGVGDQVLRHVASTLASCVRPGDLAARLGGDEFVVLLPRATDEAAASRVAQRILDALSEPFEVDGRPIRCTPSIGISRFPHDATDAHSLVRLADFAMYEAKRQGRNRYCHFKPSLAPAEEGLIGMDAELRQAIAKGEFELWLQPKVDLDSGAVDSAEVLLRWRRPQRGVLAPGDFLPAAEERGLLPDINSHVLQRACELLARRQRGGQAMLPLAVNLSADHFARAGWTESLRDRLTEHRLAAEWLHLEITESTLLHEDPVVMDNIRALRHMGVRLSLDDFGTGYSALSYLDRIQVDELKIDRSFIDRIRSPDDAASLVRAIIGIGKEMRLNVVGEGVETRQQAEFLRTLGCHHGQGYWFARPMPEPEFDQWLARHAQTNMLTRETGHMPLH